MGIESVEQKNKKNSKKGLDRADFTSRIMITSSVVGMPMDGARGEGGPFVNSMIRVLLKNSNPKISISELIQQTGIEMNATYPQFNMIPGIGNIKNAIHQGGEFNFKLKEEFIKLSKNTQMDEKDFLEKSISESIKRLEKEFLLKLETNQKIYEERIKQVEKTAQTEKKTVNKKDLLRLLKKDKIEKYFDEVDLIQELIEDNILKELIILQSRWTAAENQTRIGIISKKEELLEKNKIRNGLIEITTTLE